MSDELSKAIVRLYTQERFYAELLIQMDRIITRRIPTAGVCIKDKVQLHVNPDFFDSLSKEEQVAVLKHECFHILNDHIPRSKEMAPEVYSDRYKDIGDALLSSAKHQVINIAADCAINSGIQNLPKNAMTPQKFKLKESETLEWYFDNLKNHKDLEELTNFDNHSIWAESDGDKEILSEKIKQAINKAAQNTKSAGLLTHEQEAIIDRVNNKSKDWRDTLRRFATQNNEVTIDVSRKKRNRRYGIQYPGVIKEEKLHIGVAIDTSGSVSDEALNQFMAEVANIAKYAKVTVVEADCEVKNSYVFDPRKKYVVKGRGGTAYKPAFDFFSKQKDVDGVIYFGDMDCADEAELVKPSYPVLWAIVGYAKQPVAWGSHVKVEVKLK